MKKILYTAFFIVLCLNAIAQKKALNQAEKEYNNYAYVNAISIFEKVAESGYQDEKLFQKLGNAYYFNAELSKALKWYDALFALNKEQEPEYYYRYSQALKSIADYSKSDEMLEIFNEKNQKNQKGITVINHKNYLEQIRRNSGRFEILDAGINSNESDYGSAILNTKLVFASARDTGLVTKKIFKWTNRSFTDLYTAEIKPDGSLGNPVKFDKNINSKFNESTPVFTKDGKTMYFTRNNFLAGTKGKNSDKITLLKLYKAEFEDGKWTNSVELPFNSDQYNTAHPSLSADEKTLYFASDMPGGYGQSDLYCAVINSDGTFGKPENLGPAVNTPGRENFPSTAQNEFYFSSDGHFGLGGLDVFTAKIKEGKIDQVQNIGEPVNTQYDDFAYIIDSTTRKGFFSSNREGGKGTDDIYQFTETSKLECDRELSGIIVDAETNEILAGVKVILLDNKFQQVAELISGSDGSYSFQLNCYEMYHIRAVKEDYETSETAVSVHPSDTKPERIVKLEKQIKKIEIGTDLAKTLNIPTIYFQLDQFSIQKEAAFELEKILAVMQQYPEMKIDVRSHTDSRQSKKYNMILSEKRAKATMEWFIKKGIAASRLSGKGYGESQLLNKCSDNIKCTEEEHKVNRRSEFVILSF
ncbi:OmpA family protein [Flavobacterium ustbae]|uniref:OmpA family protein n=1 Tax=Flavobacterium ustbae TaxID=2488790 RepID=UPI002938D0C8|nr:OmpA family protein [Flavobacterium ustbae]